MQQYNLILDQFKEEVEKKAYNYELENLTEKPFLVKNTNDLKKVKN